MKTSVGWFSLSIRREGQDEDYVKGTTSVSTLSYEIVGFGGDDIDSTTLTSVFKGRVGSITDEPELTTWKSLLEGSVGSTTDETKSTTWSTSGGSRYNLR